MARFRQIFSALAKLHPAESCGIAASNTPNARYAYWFSNVAFLLTMAAGRGKKSAFPPSIGKSSIKRQVSIIY
jgi:hypothetical protein